jgi:GNAT superfamily N-acetyltransferase
MPTTINPPPMIACRQAVLADLDRVARLFDLYRQFYNQPSDIPAATAFLRDRLNHGESVIFIAEQGSDAVGFTQLYPSYSSVSMARVFILNDLFVAAHMRRHGVGAKLLKAATAYGQAMGAVRVSLNTDVRNTAAQATYEALGWVQDRTYFTYHFNVAP